jgi:sugar phosphate isomerase/epimerase
MAYRCVVRRDAIALELYTVRRPMAADLAATLRSVAEVGYRSVEVAGLPPVTPQRLAGLLAENGLRPVASHEPIEALRADPAAVAERFAAIGCRRAIVPWMPEADRRSPDDVRAFAVALSDAAVVLARQGIRVGYHNHAFEFELFHGTTVWDVLLAELSSDVDLELDVFWASVGGRDPVEVLRRESGRIRLLHMKDLAPGPEPRDVPPGQGILDFPAIIEAGRAGGVEWYVVEQDEPLDPLADIATGLRYLEGIAA